jgi:UDP-glucose 4-epimerase
MKVLITGSQGYIARNFCKKLSKSRITCYGIGRGDWKKKADFKKWGYYQNVSGTINKQSLRKFKNNKFDYIIHLAGGSSPTASIIDSISNKKDFEKNVLSTRYILEYIRSKNNKAKFILMSTIAVIGNNEVNKIREESKVTPISNYTKNKVEAEKLCFKYNKDFGIDTLIIRGSSIYGPGMNKQIIHDVCLKITKKKNIFFGSGGEERDFIYIDDICSFMKKIIQKSFKGYKIINIGTGKGTKIKKIINYLNHKLGKKIKPKFNKIGLDINPKKLIPNIKKAKELDWKPKVSLYQGLNLYLKWFSKNYKND